MSFGHVSRQYVKAEKKPPAIPFLEEGVKNKEFGFSPRWVAYGVRYCKEISLPERSFPQVHFPLAHLPLGSRTDSLQNFLSN